MGVSLDLGIRGILGEGDINTLAHRESACNI